MQPGTESPSSSLGFLSGGGNMGAMMRSHDWGATPLGPLESWPQSLRSALSICLESQFQIAVYWGKELSLVYNDPWSQIPGDKHPWALGRPAREVWPEIWDTIGPLFTHVLSTGQATRSKDALLAMHRRGFTEECYFDYTFSPIRDEAGGVGGIFNIAVETTFRVLEGRRQRLLRDLREATGRARTAEEVCTLAASVFSSDSADLPFCLIYLAESQPAGNGLRLVATTGNTPDSLTDFPWPIAEADGSSGVLVENLSARLGMPLPGGPWPEPCDRALVVPIPGLVHAEPSGILVAGISPRLKFDLEYRSFVERIAASLAADIAKVRAYEQERRRAEALAEIDRAKTTFFSNISHEFRTPLTLMLGPLGDTLQQEPGISAAGREQMELAHRNGLRLQKLVNTLLDFSRIEAGRVQANYEPTDLEKFTEELASNFRSACARAGLDLMVDCAPIPEPVYVDREMWEKIVLNLLSNAFKFTLEGSIRVSLQPVGPNVELKVIDTGAGIPEAELPHLFERFHRVEGAQGRSMEGSGIGLALVQELVKFHGGSVWAESVPGQGSAFHVSIPRGMAHLPAERIGASRLAVSTSLQPQVFIEEVLRWLPPAASGTATAALAHGPTPVETRGKVLLADDNADMRDYVRRLLSERFQVIAVSNGEEALRAAQADPPDLVLADIMMPGLDGFGLLRALRSDSRMSTTPIILLSARAGEESRVEGLDAGADDYLTKPFSARELIARVASHLEISRLRKEALESARRANQELEQFAYAAAHDLQEPLRAVSIFLELLQRKYRTQWDNESEQWISECRDGAQRMTVLIRDLLNYSLATSAPEVSDKPADLNEIACHALAALRTKVEETSADVVIGPLPSLAVEPVRCHQLFQNLIGNALKYSEAGRKPVVRVSAERKDSDWIFSVSDNGVGIEPEYHSRVFEMFKRLHSKQQSGSGLGLTICKKIVERYGGHIWVESEPGTGATFRFSLPARLEARS